MFTVVLINHTTRTDLTLAWFARLAAGLTVQLSRDLAPDWALPAWGVTTLDVAGPTQQRIHFFDHSDQANAAGYHAVDPNGIPYGRVFCEGCSVEEIEVTASHEACELVVDQDADAFIFPLVGTPRALEVSDPVEDLSYRETLSGVMLSNYVLPAWFRSETKGPWDKMGALPGPLTRTAGGYFIELLNAGTPNAQGARLTVATNPSEAAKRQGKLHPASRTARRLARNVPLL